ncbi:MAG: ATP-binding protein [Deltaproteobacteria bacterium]|nr:ATP-binding protein [Deltaproteobacteria bacterium]
MTDWLRIFLDVEKKKPILVNLQELIKSRALLQANSGGGKSHAMRKGIEEAHGKVQQIIIDPEGEFPTLREHYSFLLVGKGPQADIQIDSKHAALLAKRIMETGADVIIDLYELNPFERIRFVKLFCEALINLPKTLWHQCLIWLDEIHIFAPESKSGRSESLAAVAALASRGRKRGYGLIGATQRISKLNKDVAAELNTKFIGRCALDIDRKRAGEELGIKDTKILRKLKHEFYAFGPAIADDNVLVKAYETKTSHEELGNIKEYIPANKKKITGLLTNFSELDLEVEQDLKTKEGLQLKIQELQTKLRQSEKNQPIIKQDTGELNRAYKKGFDEATVKFISTVQELHDKRSLLKILKMGFVKINKSKNEIFDTCDHAVNEINKALSIETKIEKPTIPNQIQEEGIIPRTVNNFQSHSVSVESLNDDEIILNKCAETCLKKLVEFNKPMTRKHLAVYSRYRPTSGGYSTSIKNLRDAGYIEENGTITPTPAGIQRAGGLDPVPTNHEDLLNHWKNKLGACSSKVLDFLCNIYYDPINSLTRPELAEATGYSPTSGGFSSSVKMLIDLSLATESKGQVKASEEMFP